MCWGKASNNATNVAIALANFQHVFKLGLYYNNKRDYYIKVFDGIGYIQKYF